MVTRGELSHAVRLLRSNGIAPNNDATLRQLTDPLLRPPARIRDLSDEFLGHQPDEKVVPDRSKFLVNLRGVRCGLG